MNLQSNDFELFGIEPRFAQDRSVLDARWKDLQREAHPDKFASQGAAAQRVAMQWSVRINEAYQRLKDPLKRASYLCEMRGVAVNAHTNTAMPVDFLMLQMQWREALEDVLDLKALETLQAHVESHRQNLFIDCAKLLDINNDNFGAVQLVRELMFIDKFILDLDRSFDKFE